MHVEVTRLFEDGRPIPRWRLAGLRSIAGNLMSSQVRLDRISRAVPCLRLLCGQRVSIELLDPRFAELADGSITFGGFELGGPAHNQYLAQTWVVQILQKSNSA